MAPDPGPGPERTPLGMRLIWLLVPAVLFGLYFWVLLRSGDGGPDDERAPTGTEQPAPAESR